MNQAPLPWTRDGRFVYDANKNIVAIIPDANRTPDAQEAIAEMILRLVNESANVGASK